MKFLNVETCRMLAVIGCVSESGEYYGDGAFIGSFEKGFSKSKDNVPKFTFGDLITRENAVKIWGLETDFSNYPYEFVWQNELHDLVDMKLAGDDWESFLYRFLKGVVGL